MKPSYIAGFYFAMVSVPMNHFFGYFRSFLFHEPFLGFLNFSYAIIDPYYKRKSYLEICEVYFWTATITNWNHLLKDDLYKEVIIGYLRTLSERELIDVFAFAPKAFGVSNHIHLIWRTNKLIRLLSDGKETAQASFLKFTAHEFKKMLRKDTDELSKYPVDAHNKKYEFWQRDSLAYIYTACT